jgi:uncharacterized membrane protein YeaQ/YmgE (transglycosylase-associated protein family)
MLIGIVCWIELGMVASLLAGRIFNRRGKGVPTNIALGIAGALGGGMFVRILAGSAATAGFDGWSLCGAFVGAETLLVSWHVIQHVAFRAASPQPSESNDGTEYAS